ITMSNSMDEAKIVEKRQAFLQYKVNATLATFSLDAPQILIGRAKDVDLRIPDNYLSGKHARILVVHNFYHIEDLGSRNGTWVNGERVTFMRLAHQDVIKLGQTNLCFLQNDIVDGNYIHKLNLQTIQSLALAVEAKDPYTKGHSERVADISENLATMMGLAEADVERVRIAGILHDIGKIGVPETLLLNKSSLNDTEYEMVKQHVVEGKNILRPLNFLSDIIPAVYHHHERFDGTGYPDGLVGEDIPLWARIIQVADTCDAMTISRPYQAAFSKAQVIEEFTRCASTQFDPNIACTMIEILRS
ncbi:MAG TPA: HD domain-containing phosphohydrolase, partial [Geobacteraceae bacterium]|nr:HD domain-containing phosphohydrolase [Geobacteraceae bacterium]